MKVRGGQRSSGNVIIISLDYFKPLKIIWVPIVLLSKFERYIYILNNHCFGSQGTILVRNKSGAAADVANFGGSASTRAR